MYALMYAALRIAIIEWEEAMPSFLIKRSNTAQSKAARCTWLPKYLHGQIRQPEDSLMT
ncbi:MAG: hypothetical protein HUJ69_06720 [Lachnospiraceae bacterium]|nr:hypothetical protein [Lachnospiraceae bacterium]